jgi:hypothetical protein
VHGQRQGLAKAAPELSRHFSAASAAFGNYWEKNYQKLS